MGSVDHIAFSPSLRHLYVPDTEGAVLRGYTVGLDGALTLLGSLPTAPGTECVATDGHGVVALCAPQTGEILLLQDRWPSRR
jgi:hypothetical protein